MPLRSLFKKPKETKSASSSPTSSVSFMNSSRDARAVGNEETPKTSGSFAADEQQTTVNSPDISPTDEQEQEPYPFPVYDSIVARSLPAIQELPNSFRPAPFICRKDSHPPVVTIRTVEAASAAKIYLETRYCSILGQNADHGSQSPQHSQEAQQQPRHFVPSILPASRLIPVPGRQRRVRSLMSQATTSQKHSNADNYQKIRVLGKGSFGTVQLVKSSSTEQPMANALCGQASRSFSGEGSSQVEVGALCADRVFAMKVIRKSDMLILSQEGHLRAERDILVASEHNKWVVPLIESFQDHDHLYLVMEYMVGGDFLNLLMRMEMLPEDTTKFYIAEMVVCIEELHKMKWIHRDVKPDNFLISSSGHLKIADFGLSFDGHWAHSQRYYNETRNALLEKLHVQVDGDEQDMQQPPPAKTPHRDDHPRPDGHLVIDQLDMLWKRRLARTMVGTSQYMAPEVILGQPYDGRCDWWSIGIILYECLYGITPFLGNTRDETKAHIVNHHGPIFIPQYGRFQHLPKGHLPLPPATAEARQLVNALLGPRDCRLSSRTYLENDTRARRHSRGRVTAASSQYSYFVFADDARDIKRHPWFRGVHWPELQAQKPPFVPRIHADQPITKYFESEKEILGEEAEAGKPRARDRILRDPKVGAEAMEIRKRYGFLGYEYRRGV